MRRVLRARVAPPEQGALLLEALMVSVVITIALLGSIASINIATRQRQQASQRNALTASIEVDLAEIQNLATQLTCCSGECTLGIPAGITPGAASPCATSNRRDDSYFFPQIASAAGTVDALCADPNQGIISDAVLAQFNALPVNADLTAAGGARQPIVRLNTVHNQAGNQNVLQVTYTDVNREGAMVRVARIVPPMARFCP